MHFNAAFWHEKKKKILCMLHYKIFEYVGFLCNLWTKIHKNRTIFHYRTLGLTFIYKLAFSSVSVFWCKYWGVIQEVTHFLQWNSWYFKIILNFTDHTYDVVLFSCIGSVITKANEIRAVVHFLHWEWFQD